MPSQISKVVFFYSDARPILKERTRLKKFILSIFGKERVNLSSIRFIFTTDQALREINKKYLGHDYYTDIITFNLSEHNKPLDGEVYISVGRVKENASIYNTSFRKELHRVIFHGVLHLCGYRDKSKQELVQMRKMEEACLSGYFK